MGERQGADPRGAGVCSKLSFMIVLPVSSAVCPVPRMREPSALNADSEFGLSSYRATALSLSPALDIHNLCHMARTAKLEERLAPSLLAMCAPLEPNTSQVLTQTTSILRRQSQSLHEIRHNSTSYDGHADQVRLSEHASRVRSHMHVVCHLHLKK